MMKFSTSALVDADIILYVTDVVEKIDKNEEFLKKVQNTDIPVILILNKIDLTTQDKLVETNGYLEGKACQKQKSSLCRQKRTLMYPIYLIEF